MVMEKKLEQIRDKNSKKRKIDVIKDLNGQELVLINNIRFQGKRSIDWEDVKEYLKEFVDNFYEIIETGEVIYIGKDLPDEYITGIW